MGEISNIARSAADRLLGDPIVMLRRCHSRHAAEHYFQQAIDEAAQKCFICGGELGTAICNDCHERAWLAEEEEKEEATESLRGQLAVAEIVAEARLDALREVQADMLRNLITFVEDCGWGEPVIVTLQSLVAQFQKAGGG